MIKKLVLMKNVAYGYATVTDVDDDGKSSYYDGDTNYVRLSEVIEVDFPELSSKDVVEAEIAVLDKQMTKVQADCQAALTSLEGRKQELLALTCDS